jgi:tRNA-splicing ligase RtcB
MNPAPLHQWLASPLPPGVEEKLLRLQRTQGVAHIAVMPDVHLASEFCVGTVVASDSLLFPNAVGGDIGCGMLAMPFDSDASPLADPEIAARILGQLAEACPARRHHRRTAHDLPPELRDQPLSHPRLESQKRSEDIRTQLGTLGAGNHFLELQADAATNQLWLMIHTGSRHLGQCIHHHFLPQACRTDTGIFALDADSPAGRAYLADVQVARAWARENRRLLALRTAQILEHIATISPLLAQAFDCDHNHLALETDKSTTRFIHRKGATAARQNLPGIIPGSMGTHSFHTRGTGNPLALHSSSHGAGRALSRTEARDRVTLSALRRQLRHVWYDARLERHLREEAPSAYKEIDAVMNAQTGLTRIIRRLQPLLVHKGV